MILQVRDEHKSHLSILFDLPVNVLQDFCKLASEYLSKGPKPKLYLSAAQKLEVEAQNIKEAIEGLVYLLIESSKNKLSLLDFRDTVLATGFSEEQEEVLSALYKSKQTELADIKRRSHRASDALPHFKDLDWRFEVQVASRSMADSSLIPNITMKLTLCEEEEDGGEEEGDERRSAILLQTDPKNLQHLTESLEAALKEATASSRQNKNSPRRIAQRLRLKC